MVRYSILWVLVNKCDFLGIWSPRVSVVEGTPLPSPRLISTSLIEDIDVPNEEFTMALIQFGQFLSHDFTQSMDMSYRKLFTIIKLIKSFDFFS